MLINIGTLKRILVLPFQRKPVFLYSKQNQLKSGFGTPVILPQYDGEPFDICKKYFYGSM